MDRATYPEVVSRYIGIRAGSPVDASLFGLAPRGVCLAALCHHMRRCALTLSPRGPHRFTHHPQFQISDLESEILFEISNLRSQSPLAGLFSVALVVVVTLNRPLGWSGVPDAPPLAGPLPFGVRTFLSSVIINAGAATAQSALFARRVDYSKSVFNTYSTLERTILRD